MADHICFYDSKEKIDTCLNCKRAKCTNCMREGGPGLSLKSDKIDPDVFMEMYMAGKNDIEIGGRFGVKSWIVQRYRRERDLPSNVKGGRSLVRA